MTIYISFREEYGKLFDFVTAKKLSIKNRGFKEVCHLQNYINFPKRTQIFLSDRDNCIVSLCMIIIFVIFCLFLCFGPEEKGWYHLWFEVVSAGLHWV